MGITNVNPIFSFSEKQSTSEIKIIFIFFSIFYYHPSYILYMIETAKKHEKRLSLS